MLTNSVEGFRGLSVQSLKSRHEDTFIVLSSVKECMDQGNSHQLKDIICDEEFKGLVEYIAWDLLPLVCPHLSEKEQNDEMYRNCIEIITRLAELGSPKEMFIGLLEQVNRFLDTVVDFLRPLQTVMRRLGLSKPLYYKQLLSTLYTHMEVLKVPSVNGMGVMERRLLSQDPDFSKVETTLVALLEFLMPIVWDVQQVFDKKEIERYTLKEITEIEGTRTVIMKFVLNLLEHPLVEMEFKYSDDADEDEREEMKELEGMDEEARERLALRNEEHSISKTSAEQCMFFLDSMGCSFMSLLLYANQHALNLDTLEEQHLRKAKKKKQDDQDDGEEEEEVKTLPVLGLGCFAYMLLVERYETNRMPSIYSAVYMLEMIMPYVEGMLRRPEESIIFKGLELLSSLVKSLDNQSLDSSLIDTRQNLLLVPQCLVQIMVMCPSKSIRRKAVSILPSYIDCFNWKGRYHILRSLLLSSEHSGVRGMLIGKIKDYVHCSLQSESSNEWFGGCHIHKLFTIIFKLDEGIQLDLLHEADKHMGALNFLRYLFLRDTPDKNATGIWSRVDWLQTTYLQPLHTCLDMSKAHYDLKMKATQAEVRQAVSEKKQMTVKLNVGGQDLPQMPPAEQYKVLQSAKYTFDLIASILGRIGEIISSGKR